MSKQREEFLNWHFLDWKSSNANDDSIDFAMDLYDRVHKHSHNQFFRARELKAWQQAQKMAVPDGFVLMPIQPTMEMIKKATHEFYDLDIDDIDDRIVFSHQAMIEAQRE